MERLTKEVRINLAIQAKKNNSKLSFKKLAFTYQIADATLRNRYNGKCARSDTIPNSRKLTPTEEKAIVERILDLDSRAFPVRLQHVEDMANLLLAQRVAERVGINWASNFVRRQKKLKTRLNRKIDYQRVLCEDPAAFQKWFDLVRDTVAKYGIAEEDIYNFDETGFLMGLLAASGMVITSTERRGRPRQAQQGNREWATVIQAVNSQGWALPPFIILAGKNHLGTWFRDNPMPRDWRIGTSSNGWTTNELGLEWIKHFDKHTRTRTKGAKRLLILDGHESHHSVEFEEYCQNNDIITLCMPAHSSHRLQPLDVSYFSVLKRAYSLYIENLMRRHQTHIAKEDFLAGFYDAFQTAMTADNVKSGFAKAGLVPFDPQNVLGELESHLVPTPTVSPLSAASSLSLPTKTPRNINEATRQSRYLQRKIKNHQSSSPTKLVEALDLLTKGTLQMAHENTLLKKEVALLRETNHILSKRRKTKNKRLQEGGTLTVQEGQDLLAEKEGSGEQSQSTAAGGGRRKRVETKGRRCGVCGKPGHNARTCQEVEETSSEEESD